jgi:hypothetical protein
MMLVGCEHDKIKGKRHVIRTTLCIAWEELHIQSNT